MIFPYVRVMPLIIFGVTCELLDYFVYELELFRISFAYCFEWTICFIVYSPLLCMCRIFGELFVRM